MGTTPTLIALWGTTPTAPLRGAPPPLYYCRLLPGASPRCFTYDNTPLATLRKGYHPSHLSRSAWGTTPVYFAPLWGTTPMFLGPQCGTTTGHCEAWGTTPTVGPKGPTFLYILDAISRLHQKLKCHNSAWFVYNLV